VRNKGKTNYGKKMSKSNNKKTTECFNCKQIRHWKKDSLKEKSKARPVLRIWSKLIILAVKGDILCVSSNKYTKM